MTRLVCVLAGIIAWTSLAQSAGPQADDVRPIDEAETVFAVYTVRDYAVRRLASPPRELIFAAWPDGHVVWSENPVEGGPPYRSAHVKPQRVARTGARLENDGLLDDANLSRAYFGPDASFTTILVRSGKRQLAMQSWHELSEANGTTVGTPSGIEALEGRRRADVLKSQ